MTKSFQFDVIPPINIVETLSKTDKLEKCSLEQLQDVLISRGGGGPLAPPPPDIRFYCVFLCRLFQNIANQF